MTGATIPLLLALDPLAEATELDVPDGIATVEIHHARVTLPDLERLFDAGYATLAGLGPIGPGYAIYHGAPPEAFDLTIGFPVAGVPDDLPDGVAAGVFPAGRALVASLVGAYDALPQAWEALADHPAVGEHDERYIEIYVSDPSVTPAAECRTDLVIPLG